MRVDVTVIQEMLPISASLDVMGGDDVWPWQGLPAELS